MKQELGLHFNYIIDAGGGGGYFQGRRGFPMPSIVRPFTSDRPAIAVRDPEKDREIRRLTGLLRRWDNRRTAEEKIKAAEKSRLSEVYSWFCINLQASGVLLGNENVFKKTKIAPKIAGKGEAQALSDLPILCIGSAGEIRSGTVRIIPGNAQGTPTLIWDFREVFPDVGQMVATEYPKDLDSGKDRYRYIREFSPLTEKQRLIFTQANYLVPGLKDDFKEVILVVSSERVEYNPYVHDKNLEGATRLLFTPARVPLGWRELINEKTGMIVEPGSEIPPVKSESPVKAFSDAVSERLREIGILQDGNLLRSSNFYRPQTILRRDPLTLDLFEEAGLTAASFPIITVAPAQNEAGRIVLSAKRYTTPYTSRNQLCLNVSSILPINRDLTLHLPSNHGNGIYLNTIYGYPQAFQLHDKCPVGGKNPTNLLIMVLDGQNPAYNKLHMFSVGVDNPNTVFDATGHLKAQ